MRELAALEPITSDAYVTRDWAIVVDKAADARWRVSDHGRTVAFFEDRQEALGWAASFANGHVTASGFSS